MKTVIALGGNAILREGDRPTYANQYARIRATAAQIAKIAKRGGKLLITHGNGPQVGDELLRNWYAKQKVPPFPLYLLNAETQATVGSMIVTALSNEFIKQRIRRQAVAVITHVEVDANDPAFKRPDKPIGPFYTHAELAKELKHEKFSYVPEKGLYRRVEPSPSPKAVLEIDAIREVFESGAVVVAGGGGGVPVIRRHGAYVGTSAVLDKDRTTQLLANKLGADTMLMLTNVDYLYKNYHDRGSAIRSISAERLKRMLPSLEAGTIRPKASACVSFIENGGQRAYIGNLSGLDAMLDGTAGTTITK